MLTVACPDCSAVSEAAFSDRLHNAQHALTPDGPLWRTPSAYPAVCTMQQQQSSRASEKLQRLLGSLSSTLAQRGASLPGLAASTSAPGGAARGDQVRGSLAAMPPASQQAFLRALLKSIGKDRRSGAELLPGEGCLLPMTRNSDTRQTKICAPCGAIHYSYPTCHALSLRHAQPVVHTASLGCGWTSGTAEAALTDALCDAADSAAAQAEAAPKCRSLPDTIQRPKVSFTILHNLRCTPPNFM